jgi:hypothetical protein
MGKALFGGPARNGNTNFCKAPDEVTFHYNRLREESKIARARRMQMNKNKRTNLGNRDALDNIPGS